MLKLDCMKKKTDKLEKEKPVPFILVSIVKWHSSIAFITSPQ